MYIYICVCLYICIYIYIYIVGGKGGDEWATTKQVCRDELVVYLSFSSHNINIALLLCIEHCLTKVKLLFIYIYIYIYIFTLSRHSF